MKIIASETVDFPSLGRVIKKGEHTVSKEEAQIFLTSPHIKLKSKTNGTHSKTRSRRDRR